jgi:hypothetical protein
VSLATKRQIFNPVASKAYPLHEKHILLSWRRGICFGAHNLLGAVDQTEDVVEHEVASGTIGLQLEALGVVHGLLLLVDLLIEKLSLAKKREEAMGMQHTRRAPVTSTTMPSPLEGWASKVAIWC